jgi:hypothetical protein
LPTVPIATFLAGSLLSLLLPTLLLIALVVWYFRFIDRAPGPADGSEPARPPTDPAKSASPEAVPPGSEV